MIKVILIFLNYTFSATLSPARGVTLVNSMEIYKNVEFGFHDLGKLTLSLTYCSSFILSFSPAQRLKQVHKLMGNIQEYQLWVP